ncbi:MAG: DUF2723 domain-containing protein [Melioribacteraceae bacterium]
MNQKLLHRIFAAVVFIIAVLTYFATMQPTVSFWDCGEFVASSYLMQVPHPPGTPFFLFLGRLFSMIPFGDNIGFRVNMVSVLASAFSILFLYLVAVKVIQNYRKKELENLFDAFALYISAAIGALSFAFSDTFWFNAVESEVYATSTFFIAFVVWLMVVWNEKADEPDSEKYLVFIFYLIGLSTGVHLMSVLAIVPVMMTVYFRKYVTDEKTLEKTGIIFVVHTVIILVVAAVMWASQTDTTNPTPEQFGELDSRFLMILVAITALFMGALYKKIFQRNSFYIPIVVGGIALIVIYPGLVKYLPKIISKLGQNDFKINIIAGIAILAAVGFGVYWSSKKSKPVLNLIFKCLFFAIIGTSSFVMIIIRANQEPPINMNSPKTFTELESYINREQYGDFPIFKRRYSNEPHQQNIYTDYSSDLDFLLRYQLNHMFNRYLFWNYIGRESFYQDSDWVLSKMLGIPFLIGIFGLFYHFRKDWKMASVFIMMFIFLGYLTVFYQNQQQPQPRERDYFYVGAFFVFSLWIAIGGNALIKILKDNILQKKILKPIIIGFPILCFIAIPFIMLLTNWFEHNRARNYVPWDYAYNLLQSVAPNAILFTNGDNDTFPLWYIQNVEGVRRDVRVACLSLVNTPWYVKQLKNTTPFGSQKVEMSLSDEEIDQIGLQRWDPTEVSVDVPPDVMKEWNITDSATVKDKKVKWLMKNTGQSGDIKFIRGQDIVALDIIIQAKWKRPVYFAVTCSDDSRLSLDDYIEMEGMAMRVVPKKNDIPRIEYINEPILRKQLFDQPTNGFSKDYQPGFLFRGLNDKTIFFDENHERLTQNYRNAFMRLALHYLYKEKNNGKTINAMEEMEKRIPRSVIPMDYRIKHDISKILFSAGDTKLYEIYAREVIEETKKHLELNPRDFSSWYNPYDLLLTHYENLKMYKEAVGILLQLQSYAPGDESVRNLLNEFRTKAGMEVSEVVPKQLDKK